MRLPLKRVPIEAVGFAPFVALAKLLTHEKELFAGMGVLIRKEKAETGELLPHVTGHFVEKRVFAMNDFIMGEGKKEIFSEGIKQREGELVVLVLAMNRIVRKIF